MQILIALAAAILMRPAAAAAQERPSRLVFATLQDAAEVEVGIAVVREAYHRLGITVEIRRFAGDESITRSSRGDVDGDVQRVDGLRFRFPDLVEVPVPISYLGLAVYSRDSTLRIRTVRDLRSLNVATVRGVPAIDRTLGGETVRRVDTFADLFPLLNDREVGAIIVPELEFDAARARGAVAPGIVRNGTLDSHLQYHYLHRRHADLVPAVDSVLHEMLFDGTTSRIRAGVVAGLLRRSAAPRPR